MTMTMPAARPVDNPHRITAHTFHAGTRTVICACGAEFSDMPGRTRARRRISAYQRHSSHRNGKRQGGQ